MITGPTTLCMTYAKSGRRVSLGVQIYEQSFPTRRGQRGRNIDGCSCLTDTTFLICNCHADHILPLFRTDRATNMVRSEEHTSELQSLMRISYAVFCLKKLTKINHHIITVYSDVILKL